MHNQNHDIMVKKTKDQYISPDCEVLKMNTEGVIALSGNFITGGDETPPGPNG